MVAVLPHLMVKAKYKANPDSRRGMDSHLLMGEKLFLLGDCWWPSLEITPELDFEDFKIIASEPLVDIKVFSPNSYRFEGRGSLFHLSFSCVLCQVTELNSGIWYIFHLFWKLEYELCFRNHQQVSGCWSCLSHALTTSSRSYTGSLSVTRKGIDSTSHACCLWPSACIWDAAGFG